jgi:hypothetical protein
VPPSRCLFHVEQAREVSREGRSPTDPKHAQPANSYHRSDGAVQIPALPLFVPRGTAARGEPGRSVSDRPQTCPDPRILIIGPTGRCRAPPSRYLFHVEQPREVNREGRSPTDPKTRPDQRIVIIGLTWRCRAPPSRYLFHVEQPREANREGRSPTDPKHAPTRELLSSV